LRLTSESERNTYLAELAPILEPYGFSPAGIKNIWRQLLPSSFSVQAENQLGVLVRKTMREHTLSSLTVLAGDALPYSINETQQQMVEENMAWYVKALSQYQWAPTGEGGVNLDGSIDGVSCIHTVLEGLLVGMGVTDEARQGINFNLEMKTAEDLPSLLPVPPQAVGKPILLSTETLTKEQIIAALSPNGVFFVVQSSAVAANDYTYSSTREPVPILANKAHHSVLIYYGALQNPFTGATETRWWVIESTAKVKPTDQKKGGWVVPLEYWISRYDRDCLRCIPIDINYAARFDQSSGFAAVFARPNEYAKEPEILVQANIEDQ
jgi:hypothetical protein